jgi:hypothetical protein|tara:strand:+ start:1984 stop:3090 length:1107 start_codon:yes stop_codon:yes gene_type:complete
MTTHSKYSASASKRWLNCPGSIQLTEKAPIQKTSDFALEGTVAHELAHIALVVGNSPKEYIGEVLEGIELFPVTEEMSEHILEYVELVRELSKDAVKVEYEKKVHLDHINSELFGTCDCIIHLKDKLIIVDLKYGQGISVDAIDNYQMQYYAIGANRESQSKKIQMVIFQPRDPYGIKTKSHEMSKIELESFGEKIKRGIKASKEKQPKYCSGEHCTFCPGLSICPELAAKSMEVAKADFSQDICEWVPPNIDLMSMDQLSFILKLSGPLTKFLQSVKGYARDLASNGTEIAGYELGEGRRVRGWVDDELAVKIIEPIFGEEIYTKKLKSPKQIIELSENKECRDYVEEQISDCISIKKSNPILKEKK